MGRFTASEARKAWSTILDRVEAGEQVVITRRGREVAVVMQPDALRRRRLERKFPETARIRESLARAAREDIPAHGLSNEWAEDLVAEIRAGRGAR